MNRQPRIVVLVLVCITVIWISLIRAQSNSFTFVNESNADISRAEVERAAQPLIDNYSAKVAVYAVVTGNKRDFTSRLTDDGLERSFSGTSPQMLAMYIATEEQYSEIRWGSDFDHMDGGRIRRDALNPALRERNFTTALVNTLREIDAELSNPLTGIKHLVKQLLSIPELWIFGGIMFLVFISYKMGWISQGDSSYDSGYYDSNDYSSSSSDSGGSSWGGGDSGGGSDGGSWDD